jgi:hypothetical protein
MGLHGACDGFLCAKVNTTLRLARRLDVPIDFAISRWITGCLVGEKKPHPSPWKGEFVLA